MAYFKCVSHTKCSVCYEKCVSSEYFKIFLCNHFFYYFAVHSGAILSVYRLQSTMLRKPWVSGAPALIYCYNLSLGLTQGEVIALSPSLSDLVGGDPVL